MSAVVLILAGAALLWQAWVGSQRPVSHRAARRAAAGPLGVGGGVVLTCGVAVAFTGMDAIGVGLVVVALVALAASLAVAAVAARRAVRVSPGPGSDPR
ncbi:MAG: hypothetical protein V9E94_00710 [Microthrixaceae bacterium]